MESSMNKVLKFNFHYFALLVIIIYVTCLNIVIYEDYWANKVDMAFGELDYLEPYIEKGLCMDFSDYIYYGPGWRRILILDFDGVWLYYCFVFIALIVYIILPMILRPNKRKFKKSYFAFDAFFWLLYFYVFIYNSIVNYPLYGVIPLIVLSPTCLTLMVWLRIRQYKILLNQLV